MEASASGAGRRLIWIGFLTVATLLATGVFACAIPFAALAALAALDTEHNDGPLLVGAVWLANQVYGFAVLGSTCRRDRTLALRHRGDAARLAVDGVPRL
jgi:hypothetical protein